MSTFEEIAAKLGTIDDPLTLLASLLAHAPTAFAAVRADGTCLAVNASLLELFGSEPPPEYDILQDDVAERQGVRPPVVRAFAGEVVRVPACWYDARELTTVLASRPGERG
jgi:PAS domain-containing protein